MHRVSGATKAGAHRRIRTFRCTTSPSLLSFPLLLSASWYFLLLSGVLRWHQSWTRYSKMNVRYRYSTPSNIVFSILIKDVDAKFIFDIDTRNYLKYLDTSHILFVIFEVVVILKNCHIENITELLVFCLCTYEIR